MPTISIIVPIYNVEKYLPKCIDSILAQTFTDFELILIDDGSPDCCGEICDEYAEKDHRIRVIHQENKGQAAARNKALDWICENSNSEWIAFIDADDWVHPEFLDILLENAEKSSADVCICGIARVDKHDEASATVSKHIQRITAGRDFVYSGLKYGKDGIWVLCDKLWKRALWQNVRLPEGRIFEDNATVYKILYYADSIVELDSKLYYYYQNPNSTTHEAFSLKKLDWGLVLKEMVCFFREQGEDELKQIVQRSYIRTLSNEYKQLCTIGEIDVAKRIKIELRNQGKDFNEHGTLTIRDDPGYYSVIHPLYSRVFWKGAAIRHKMRKKK